LLSCSFPRSFFWVVFGASSFSFLSACFTFQYHLAQAATKLEAIQRGNHDRKMVRQMKQAAIEEHAEETGLSEEEVSQH
jgi:hypothetical protein